MSTISTESFLAYKASDLSYSLEVDARTILPKLASFNAWPANEVATDAEKTTSLIEAISEYSDQINADTWPPKVPKTEIQIIKDLLSSLVLQDRISVSRLST